MWGVRAALVAGGIALALSLPAHAADSGWLQPGADNLQSLGIPAVIAQVSDGAATHTAVSGKTKLPDSEPPLPESRFHIASNTKTFTAVVVLQLVAEGALRLDDTVEQWLPGLVSGNGNDGRRIRVRNLLQHTSGLVDYGADLPIRSADDWTRERLHHYAPGNLVALSMSHPPLWLPEASETRFSYSNVNYVLLGMLIEKATGRSWAEEVRSRIISPLHLTSTFAEALPEPPSPMLRSYVAFGPNEPLVDTTEFDPSMVWSAGGIISTAADLNRFYRQLLGGQILRPRELALMQETIDAKEMQELYPGARYGFGLIWRPLSCGGGFWGHVGEGAAGATRDGVTGDGARSVVVHMSTQLTDPLKRRRQEQLAGLLIDRALCKGAEK